MKKWPWYFAILAAAAFLGARSGPGQDVGKLQPVQVVCVYREVDAVVVQTDTGDCGVGETLRAATENMNAAAAGEVFLETADHLLVAPDCVDLIGEAMELLRPSSTLCLMEGQPDLTRVGQFLQSHQPEVTLVHYRAGRCDLQTLKTENGRMTLVS